MTRDEQVPHNVYLFNRLNYLYLYLYPESAGFKPVVNLSLELIRSDLKLLYLSFFRKLCIGLGYSQALISVEYSLSLTNDTPISLS